MYYSFVPTYFFSLNKLKYKHLKCVGKHQTFLCHNNLSCKSIESGLCVYIYIILYTGWLLNSNQDELKYIIMLSKLVSF